MTEQQMQTIAIDASVGNVFVTPADGNGAPGRPTMTVAMDVMSRAIVGSWIVADGDQASAA